MGQIFHRWCRDHALHDYAQTMVLAKLIAGCPVDVKHSCPKCLKEKNRQAQSLFSSLRQISPAPSEFYVDRYAKQQRRQQVHRNFLEAKEKYGKRKPYTWYSRKLGVSLYMIREWWDVESKNARAKTVLSKPSGGAAKSQKKPK